MEVTSIPSNDSTLGLPRVDVPSTATSMSAVFVCCSMCCSTQRARNSTGKKTPGGAGTHTGHTGHTGARGQTDHTDEPHTIHPNPKTQTRTKTATDSTAARTAASRVTHSVYSGPPSCSIKVMFNTTRLSTQRAGKGTGKNPRTYRVNRPVAFPGIHRSIIAPAVWHSCAREHLPRLVHCRYALRARLESADIAIAVCGSPCAAGRGGARAGYRGSARPAHKLLERRSWMRAAADPVGLAQQPADAVRADDVRRREAN